MFIPHTNLKNTFEEVAWQFSTYPDIQIELVHIFGTPQSLGACALDNMTYEEIREFRYAIERQALVLAIGNVTEENRKKLTEHLEGMENGSTEEEQTFHDRMIHATIVKMSDNRLVIANYMALTRVIDRFISEIRSTIRHRSEEEFRQFQSVHRRLVEAICSKDLDAGRKVLDDHFVFLQQNIDT